MKVPGIVENGVVRPLTTLELKEGLEVDIVLPEVEKDGVALERRKTARGKRPKRDASRSRRPGTTMLRPEDLSREVEIDAKELARRRKCAEMHRKLVPIDIRPLTTTQLVREDRESH